MSSSTQKRCVSGLHEITRRGPCLKCRDIRTSIWSSENPYSKMARIYGSMTDELAEAEAFCKRRDAEEMAAKLREAEEINARCAKRQAEYTAENRSKLRSQSQNIRARNKRVQGRLSESLTDKLIRLQKGKCPCCKLPLGDKFHLDHIVPLYRGGKNTDDNIQLLRAECNLQKSSRDPMEFMDSRGFLL